MRSFALSPLGEPGSPFPRLLCCAGAGPGPEVPGLHLLPRSAGFGAMLLSSVLLLTEVWRYSVLHAGLALMPGPLMAAIFAAPAGRLGAKIGQAP